MNEAKQPNQPETEQVLDRFVCTGTGGQGTMFYELVFTQNRLIIAYTGGQPYLKLGEMLRAAEKSKKKAATLQQLTPEQILADDSLSKAIPYSDITNIEMNPPGFLGTARVKIQTTQTSKRQEFKLALKKQVFQGHIDFVRSVLKENVTVK